MELNQRIKILVGGNDYTHPAFHIQLRNPKYNIVSIRDSEHQIDYTQLAKEIMRYITIGKFHVVKGILELINYSLFLHESQVDTAFMAISKIDLVDNPRIKRLLFSELVRLNIWALISQGKAVLKGQYKPNEYLNIILDNMPFALYKIHQAVLPKALYEEVKNSEQNQVNQMMAVKDVVHYMVKHHVEMKHIIMNTVLKPKVSSVISNLSSLVNQGIQNNDPDSVQAGLALAKSTIIHTVRREPKLDANQFEQFHQQIITKSLDKLSYNRVAFSILQMIGDFDLFLMRLKPSAYILRNNVTSMQDCLRDLLANNDSLQQIGIKLTLKMPVRELNREQVTAALYSFIDFLRDNKTYILKRMVTKHIL